MAVVLPQGRFNNSSDKNIREFISDRCRILAVVGLHGNVFKPHTGTKTSVLFVQKWDEMLCPKTDDYPIFFATMQEPSKDNSGEKIYIKEKDLLDWGIRKKPITEEEQPDVAAEPVDHYNVIPKDVGSYVLDENDHLVVKHDLFSSTLKNNIRTPDGIAEVFEEFAKKERLSFFL
jgi:type I restriction enzyme M protein